MVARDAPGWAPVMERFAAAFGPVVDTLRGLSDFRLFCLTPERGSYVRGFGAAYELSGPALSELRQLRGPGG